MKMKKSSQILIVSLILLTLIIAVIMGFLHMRKSTAKLNEETVEDIGMTYLSTMTMDTTRHAQTYFKGRFEIIHHAMESSLPQSTDFEKFKSALTDSIAAEYIALLAEDGQREVIIGDPTIIPYDEEYFIEQCASREDKVLLTTKDNGEHMIEMMHADDFTVDGKKYSAILCDIPVSTLNNLLNLSYDNQSMTYSFVIRRRDSEFVIKNEDAHADNYYTRIRNYYEDYNGKTNEDYIKEISTAMKNGDEYQAVFYMNGAKHMLFARKFHYSEWYLISFIRFSEIDNILAVNRQRNNNVYANFFLLVCVAFAITFAVFFTLTFSYIKELKHLKNEAVSANKSKSEFLSNMSHDIRTPMNIIVGMTDIARSSIDDKKKVEECLTKITKSSRHLLSLINDVLDMSKIESGKMTLSKMQVSLRESLDGIVAIIQPQLKAKNQEFDIYIHDVCCENIYCDNLRLNQILINLLSNAVKYTQEGGCVSLSLSQEASPLGNSYVRNHFYVRDNGIGMTKEFISTMYNSFTREDKFRVTKEEGTGLGLAITKHIIDVMNGTIDVESEPGKGSEFHITLDFKRCDIPETDMSLEGMRVLVVDDDLDLCESAVYTLNDMHADAQFVTSGYKALDLMQDPSNRFDVLLIDLQMPDMNGVETTRMIRECTGNHVPVIIISAYDWTEFEQEARDVGANGFITKPLFKSTLFFGIKQILEPRTDDKKDEALSIHFNNERILIAEDNELNREIAIAILTNAGLQVECAENGKICTEKFAASPKGYYRAILMDIRMPVMDGYKATEIIRAMDREDSDIPIIAMTADAFSEDVAKAVKCGMNGHAAKPLDMKTLFYLLKREMKIYETKNNS